MDLGKEPTSLAALLNEAGPGLWAITQREELPVRYARRISMLETLPEWQTKESIRPLPASCNLAGRRHVREMYVKSFKAPNHC